MLSATGCQMRAWPCRRPRTARRRSRCGCRRPAPSTGTSGRRVRSTAGGETPSGPVDRATADVSPVAAGVGEGGVVAGDGVGAQGVDVPEDGAPVRVVPQHVRDRRAGQAVHRPGEVRAALLGRAVQEPVAQDDRLAEGGAADGVDEVVQILEARPVRVQAEHRPIVVRAASLGLAVQEPVAADHQCPVGGGPVGVDACVHVGGAEVVQVREARPVRVQAEHGTGPFVPPFWAVPYRNPSPGASSAPDRVDRLAIEGVDFLVAGPIRVQAEHRRIGVEVRAASAGIGAVQEAVARRDQGADGVERGDSSSRRRSRSPSHPGADGTP